MSAARLEDAALIRGAGRYTDDLVLPGQAYAHIVRSPHAHARIVAIEPADALTAPGVLAVFTHADLAAAGIGTLPCVPPLKSRDGKDRLEPARHALARERVRHVGDPVACVIAESPAAARDGAERVVVEYEPLPAVANAVAALAPDAPQLGADIPGNCAFDWEGGDAARTKTLFEAAHRVVSLTAHNQRLVGNALEPRAVNASFDAASGRFTLHAASQGVHMLRGLLARAFGLPAERFHVLTPDVGGGFGPKFYFYPEQVLAAFAARALGRPVKWTAERSESFVSDSQGRDLSATLSMALDGNGRMLALRLDAVANLGAYLSTFAAVIPAPVACAVLPSVYAFEAVHARVRGALTNTVPVDAYRGSGKPEIHFLVERLIDRAAGELGIDRVELRRRNLVPPDRMPWRNAIGTTYDSGDFPRMLERALSASDWTGATARKAQALKAGRLHGIGLACYVESTGGARTERAAVRFCADDTLELVVGTQSSGQGHATAYRKWFAARLGLAVAAVTLVQGDSDRATSGGGTGGSRSLSVQGTALAALADDVVARGRAAAAEIFGCAPADVVLSAGTFRCAGGAIGVMELARRLCNAAPDSPASRLDGAVQIDNPSHNFPNGCHVAEVEIDPDSGRIALLRYTSVDDFGNILEPALVAGQVHGGVAQGVGQALCEHAVYDGEGQLLTGSLMDYALPRAGQLPTFVPLFEGTLCTTNPLGVKGAGEAGSVGSPAAVVNAVVDALKDYGVDHLDMPATPARVWAVLKAGRR